jgi:hypothetical protein
MTTDGSVLAWGYEARKQWNAAAVRASGVGLEYVHAFKMGLINEHNAESIITLVSAYLRQLVEYATHRIQQSGYASEDILWCLTVPAIWTDFQKQAMRKAATSAGLPADNHRLIFALEPEAAAHYARISGLRTSGISGKRANLMSPRSRFMVVDCGGGTVDITSYRSDSNNNLEEIGNDCGGPYGSDYLNRAFVDQILLSRFSSWARVRELAVARPAAFASFVEAWEKEKANGEYPVASEIYIPIPAALHSLLTSDDLELLGKEQDGTTDALILSEAEISSVFEQVVPEIMRLVDKQLGDMTSQRRGAQGSELIVLVGGFSASSYLQSRLKGHVDGRADVLVPPDPQGAVLTGAVHYAYDPQIRSRKTKLTYGIGACRPFISGVDPVAKRFEDDDGRAMCDDYFSTFVTAKQIVRIGMQVSHPFVPVRGSQNKLAIAVYATRDSHPRYIDQEGMTQLGEISVDLTPVMSKSLNERSVMVSMFFGETELRVQAEVRSTGESVEATIRFEPLDSWS